jgi:uncharacterized protein YggE
MREMEQPTGITVEGVGVVARPPDRATVTFGATARALSAAEAHRTAGGRMRSVLAALARLGIDAADLATRQIQLSPTYDYSESGQRLTGYLARQTLEVSVPRLDELPAVLDRAVSAGADEVASVALGIDDDAASLREARAAAVADARARAETLAVAAGVRVGPTTAIREAPREGPIVPLARMEARAADTPVAPGTIELTVRVEVTFAIE